jgi:hypothetical protein
MRSPTRISYVMLAFLLVAPVSVRAEDAPSQTATGYMPRLGDVMAAIQLRHSKLWYAGSLKNWALADYELTQFLASLQEAKRFYPDMPASSLSATDKLTATIGESLRERNDSKFARAFAKLTAECNTCHQTSGKDFIAVRNPTFPYPYGGQVFAPSKK